MSSLVYLILLAALFNFFLGLLVLTKNWKNLLNLFFFFYTLISSLLLISEFIFRFLPPTMGALRLTYAFGMLVAPFSYLWVAKLIKDSRYKLKFIIILLPSLVFFYYSLFSGKIVKKIIYITLLGYKGELGGLFNYYTALILVPSVYIIIKLFIAIFNSKKVTRAQLKLILMGYMLYMLGGATFSLILPSFGNYNFTMLDAQSTLFFVGFSAYAIVKHRFLDIRAVVARSLTYFILLVTLAGIYAGSVLGMERLIFPNEAAQFNLFQNIIRTIVAVVMVFLFQPLKRWITKATDKIFFKNQYDPQSLMDDLSHTISTNIIMIEMLYKVNDLLIKNLKLSRSGFVILKDDGSFFTSQALGYRGWPPINLEDFHHMAKKGLLVYDELEEGTVYKKLLHKYDASVFLPLYADNKLVGIYLAGEKNSGDMFSQKDIQMLEIMAPEVSLAVENSKSYEEISRFNVTLRQEVKRATKRLKDKNTELQELDKAKDEFISMASHQLRTPLTAIKGYLSMLLEGDAGEIKVSQYDFINEAYSGANRMVGLINDLLNVSRMETGRFFLEPKDVDIEKIVGEEVKQLANHAREKGIYLKVEKKGKIPHIWADETKIRQVVMNFIDNAIYYTQKGGVTVKLSKDKENFIFNVVDTGIGVPKEQQKKLFQKFFRADNARTTRPDGTGLGIYLAKRVTEDHGGKVVFHSEEGVGSTFGFTFPIKARIRTKIASAPALDIANRPAAPALVSASTTFSEKAVGIEPPVPASVEAAAGEHTATTDAPISIGK